MFMVEWPDENLKKSFEKKLPEWIKWCDNHIPNRITLLEECSCGGKRYCCNGDLGIVDYKPHSVHICNNLDCGYFEQKEMRSSEKIIFPDIFNQKHCEICKELKKD